MAVRFLPARPGGNLLDVGCGRGDWLAFMSERGWWCEGVEPDPAAAEAASRQGVRVHTGTLDEQQFQDNSFDAVSLCHVLEHVPNPVDLLRECKRILRPGGRLVMVTPNSEGLGIRVFGADWRGLEPPRHLHLFNIPTLRRAIGDAGLRVETLKAVTTSRYTFQESWALRHGRPAEEGARAARFWAGVDFAARAFVSGLGEAVVAVARA
jgi:2-polyprenyl-3-methyl-5-hydroxy-6-metoxy-1,4-benzoquinol methylase